MKNHGKNHGRFEKGKPNPGGTRNNGGGRPPDWFRHKCEDALDKFNLVEFVTDVARGQDFEQGVNQNGETIKIPANIKDRLKAVELLKQWGIPETVKIEVTRSPEELAAEEKRYERLHKYLVEEQNDRIA